MEEKTFKKTGKITLAKKSGNYCKENGCPSACNNWGYSTCGGIHQYTGNLSEPNPFNQSIVCFCPNPYKPFTKRTAVTSSNWKTQMEETVEEVCGTMGHAHDAFQNYYDRT